MEEEELEEEELASNISTLPLLHQDGGDNWGNGRGDQTTINQLACFVVPVPNNNSNENQKGAA